jgi:hypothetical protein
MICPTCETKFRRTETDFPPFCSERCKLIDLGKWLDGSYTIPGEPGEVPENIDGDEESSD